jgi:hypothetical protein
MKYLLHYAASICASAMLFALLVPNCSFPKALFAGFMLSSAIQSFAFVIRENLRR